MSAAGVGLDDIVARIAALSEPGFVEPARAYAVAQRQGFTRVFSGEDKVEPDRVRAHGAGNVVATGFQASSRKLDAVRIVGDRNLVFFGPHANINSAEVAIEGSDNLVYFGAFATAGQVGVRVEGQGLTAAIGDRSMLSNRIFLGKPDRRALFSRATGQRLDPPGDVRIGPHCWIGRDVLIEPGTTIGRDSIVGQCAVVRGVFPEAAILIGSPARVARDGITWARTWEDTYAETLGTKHYKLLYLRNAERLRERIAALS